MNFLDEINNLSKIVPSENESNGMLSFMFQFAPRVANFLNVERINIWLLNKEKNAIFSIVEYDKRNDFFNHNTWIFEKDVPNYFKHIRKEKIILAPNIHEHPATYEFSDNYAKEYDVISLMDVPLQINGELIGVMCFEKTGNQPRVFNELEQTFAIALAQLALAQIENHRRKNIQKRLENALREKELLIKELNHRVKNNFSVLVSLLRLSKDNVKKEKEDFFETFEHQVFSMLKVHELLMDSQNPNTINLPKYLKKLSDEFISSYPHLSNRLHFNIPTSDFNISTKNTVYLGLIVTEIFLNSLKYCLLEHSGEFEMSMNILSNDRAEIVIGDSCNNFVFEEVCQQQHSLGLSIIKELLESAGYEASFPTKNNSKYKIIVTK